MDYRFAVNRPDYSHLASGHVLYSLPGHPAFPVRLASEIFQRCLEWRRRAGQTGPCTLFDPCCGAGYSLSVVALLHREALQAVVGADVDAEAVHFARRNLSLLTPEGLNRRIGELEALLTLYGKPSHREALRSAAMLRSQLLVDTATQPLVTSAFQADATDSAMLRQHLAGRHVDLVFTDIPYGVHSHWSGADSRAPLDMMLEALLSVMAPGAVVAIAADKATRPANPPYRRLEHFQVGKRRIVILQTP